MGNTIDNRNTGGAGVICSKNANNFSTTYIISIQPITGYRHLNE